MSKSHSSRRAHNFKDLAGRAFERLYVVRYHGQSASKKAVWWCRCECGVEKPVVAGSLMSGKARSCGCLESELTRKRNAERAIHGMTETPEWKAWKGAIDRCHNPNDPNYPDYGGRGIKVCDEWRESFEAFFAHVGPKPSSHHSIDRFPDMDGDYRPGNVRWATVTEQNQNRRNVRRFLFCGEKMTIREIAAKTGFRYGLLWERLVVLGWSIERATSQDPKSYHGRNASHEA